MHVTSLSDNHYLMLTRPILLAALAGAVAMFFYGATEWLNPLLHAPYQLPPQVDAFNAQLAAAVPDEGIYTWPQGEHGHNPDGSISSPQYFLVKRSADYYQPGRFMAVEFVGQLVTWGLIAFLMVRLGLRTHCERVGLALALAGVVGLGYFLPMWNWWGFPTEYVLVRWGNLAVGWTLAGAAASWALARARRRVPTASGSAAPVAMA